MTLYKTAWVTLAIVVIIAHSFLVTWGEAEGWISTEMAWVLPFILGIFLGQFLYWKFNG